MHGFSPPSAWVRRCAVRIPPAGRVLDLACGAGRHARLLLELGHPVTAIDRDVSRLRALAGDPRLEILEADLECGAAWPFTGRQFAGVVVTDYLFRPLLPALVAAVADPGVLIYETFAAGNERFGRPRDPEFLLRESELLDAAGALTVVAYEHGEVAWPRPAVRQRICAVRGLAVVPDPVGPDVAQ